MSAAMDAYARLIAARHWNLTDPEAKHLQAEREQESERSTANRDIIRRLPKVA